MDALNAALVRVLDFLEAGDRWFSIALELASLLILAPLTAQFVEWREHAKWRNLRTEIVSEVLDLVSAIRWGIEGMASGLPSGAGLAAMNENFSARLEAEVNSENWDYSRAPGLLLEVRNKNTYEAVALTAPAESLKFHVLAQSSSEKLAFAISSLDALFSKYVYCLSPDMIEVMSSCFSDEQFRKSKSRIADYGYYKYGLLKTKRDSLVLPTLERASDDIRSAIYLWHEKADRMDDEVVRSDIADRFRRLPTFQFEVIGRSLNRLVNLSGVRGSRRRSLREKVTFITRNAEGKVGPDEQIEQFISFLGEDYDDALKDYLTREKAALAILRERNVLEWRG